MDEFRWVLIEWVSWAISVSSLLYCYLLYCEQIFIVITDFLRDCYVINCKKIVYGYFTRNEIFLSILLYLELVIFEPGNATIIFLPKKSWNLCEYFHGKISNFNNIVITEINLTKFVTYIKNACFSLSLF